MRLFSKLKSGKYTNKKGKQYEIHNGLATAMMEDYFSVEPKIQQSKEHPPAGILLTANEIAKQYGSKEESKES